VPPKVLQTSKGGLRRGKEGRIAFLLPHFPLLKNPPPFDPPPRIIPIARRPQNRSGIRSSLTRSDLVLGRLLVQRFENQHAGTRKSCHATLAMTGSNLADNALNARLPRHFADGRNGDRARRWGFRGDFQGGTKGRRNAMRPPPSPLERI
jgi:hypothetical protein